MLKDLSPQILNHDKFWAIEPEVGTMLFHRFRSESAGAHAVAYQAHLERLEAYRSGGGDRSQEKPYLMQDGIAILGVEGVMTRAETSWGDGTSTVRMRRLTRAAKNDEDVRGVFFQMNTPGGSVSGTDEFAEEVAALSAVKPTYFHVEGQCCSAGMWVASKGTKILTTRTSILGSLGTLMVTYDASRMAEAEGLEVLVFSTGPHKGAGVYGSKVTDEQRAEFQRTVDELNAIFMDSFAAGRGISSARAKDLFDGRVHVGAGAISLGIADGLATWEEALAQLKAVAPPARETRAIAPDAPGATTTTSPTEATNAEDKPDPLAFLREAIDKADAATASPTRK